MLLVAPSGIKILTSLGSFSHLKICTSHLSIIHFLLYIFSTLPASFVQFLNTQGEETSEGMKASVNIWRLLAKCKICPTMEGSAFRGIIPSGTMKTRSSKLIQKQRSRTCPIQPQSCLSLCIIINSLFSLRDLLSLCHCFTALQVSLFQQNVSDTPTEHEHERFVQHDKLSESRADERCWIWNPLFRKSYSRH